MAWDVAMVYIALVLLVVIVGWEWMRNKAFVEGFTDGVVPEFFGRYFPRRYDVTPGMDREGDGWIRNPRYFEGYVDLQRLGYKGDFCRVIEKENAPESRILACALAGQEGLDSMTYRTESARTGMRFGRDDYVRDVDGDGREDYCRILKVQAAPNDQWEARAVLAGLTRFKQGAEVADHAPPPHIADLLWFYEGIMTWYRFADDMLDYAENTQLQIAGRAAVDETPRRTVFKGLELNRVPSADESQPPPASQFLTIGENPRLEMDSIVQMRNMRAVSVWAYFDEFTNNARIFDFGNGAGRDNILLGIEGRGNRAGAGFGALAARPPSNAAVCQRKPAREVSPQAYLTSSDANVDAWICDGPEPVDSTYPEDEQTDDNSAPPTANLLFEIWDERQRKMQIRVLDVIPRKRWVHVAVTATDVSSIRPNWQVFIDGKMVYEEESGHVPLKNYLTRNYIGRSNWERATATYQDADERFRGALFDFRLYRTPMSADKIRRTVEWGREKLGLLQDGAA